MAGEIIGICCLESDRPECFAQHEIGITQALLAEAAVAIQNAGLYEEINTGRERLQALSRRLVAVQEMERRYIARELHDDTSQALIGLVFALEIIKRDAGNPEAVASGVAEVDRIISEILDGLHRLAVDLRPSALDHLGLDPGGAAIHRWDQRETRAAYSSGRATANPAAARGYRDGLCIVSFRKRWPMLFTTQKLRRPMFVLR